MLKDVQLNPRIQFSRLLKIGILKIGVLQAKNRVHIVVERTVILEKVSDLVRIDRLDLIVGKIDAVYLLYRCANTIMAVAMVPAPDKPVLLCVRDIGQGR